MSTPEGKVKTFIDNWMKRNFPEAIRYSPPGVGVFGKNGMPDRIWWIRATDEISVTVAIEAKAVGNTPTDLQKTMLMKMRAVGIVAAVVTGKDAIKMEAITNEVRRRIRLANGGPE